MNTRESGGETLLKLDLGCGTHKQPGHVGVDCIAFPDVDVVADLRKPWPWPDQSAGRVYCSHFLEHLEAAERIHFANELYRVMAPGSMAMIVTPHWSSARAYGDLTHKWPPVAEYWYYYLHKEWREPNAPHNDFYRCDFDIKFDYTLREDLKPRSDADKVFALNNYKDAAQDLIAWLTRR